MLQNNLYPIQGITVHTRHFNSSYSVPVHSLHLHQLYAVLDGTIEHTVGGKVYRLNGGDALWIGPGVIRCPRAASAKGDYLVVVFNSPWPALGAGTGRKVKLDRSSYRDAWQLGELSKEKRQSHALSIVFHRMCMNLLGVKAFSSLEEPRVSGSQSSDEYEGMMLQRAEAFMTSNLDHPLRLEEIASLTGVSRSTIDRLFRKKHGQSPCLFYRRLRLERAKVLIQKGDKSITEVAIETGFASSQHFATQFKNHFKITPSQLYSQP